MTTIYLFSQIETAPVKAYGLCCYVDGLNNVQKKKMPLVFKLKIFQTRGAAPFWRARKVGGSSGR